MTGKACFLTGRQGGSREAAGRLFSLYSLSTIFTIFSFSLPKGYAGGGYDSMPQQTVIVEKGWQERILDSLQASLGDYGIAIIVCLIIFLAFLYFWKKKG